MSLSEKEIELCKLKYKDDLNDEEIGVQIGIVGRTVRRWLKREEIQAEVKHLEDQDKESAKRESIRWARRSVKTLVKLQDIAIVRNEAGEVISEEFKFGADVARKAAVDLLEMAGVKVNVEEGEKTGGVSSIVIVQSGNGNRTAENNKPEAIPNRFRFQQN